MNPVNWLSGGLGKRREKRGGAEGRRFGDPGSQAHLVVVQLLFGEDGLLVPHGGRGAVARPPGRRLPSAAAGAPRPRPSPAPRRAASDGRRTRNPAPPRPAAHPEGAGPEPGRRGARPERRRLRPAAGEGGRRAPHRSAPRDRQGASWRGRRCPAGLAPVPASAGRTQELPAARAPLARAESVHLGQIHSKGAVEAKACLAPLDLGGDRQRGARGEPWTMSAGMEPGQLC